MRRSRAITAVFGLVLVIQACSPSAASPRATCLERRDDTGCRRRSALGAQSHGREAVELTLLEHQKPRLDVLAKIIPMCEASLAEQGMNVKVNVTGDVVEDEQFRQTVTILYQGDSPPDITSYPGAWVPGLRHRGVPARHHATSSRPGRTGRRTSTRSCAIAPSRPTASTTRCRATVRSSSSSSARTSWSQNGISTDQPNSWQELIDRLTALHAKTNLPAITIPAGKTWGGGTFDEGFIHIFNGTGGKLYDDATRQVDRQEPGTDRRLQLLQHPPEGRTPANEGAARSAAVGTHQVRRLHGHDRGWQGDPGGASDHDPGIVGLGLRLGPPPDRRPADPRHL